MEEGRFGELMHWRKGGVEERKRWWKVGLKNEGGGGWYGETGRSRWRKEGWRKGGCWRWEG